MRITLKYTVKIQNKFAYREIKVAYHVVTMGSFKMTPTRKGIKCLLE